MISSAIILWLPFAAGVAAATCAGVITLLADPPAGNVVIITLSASSHGVLTATIAAFVLLGLGFRLPRGYAYLFATSFATMAPVLLVIPLQYLGAALPSIGMDSLPLYLCIILEIFALLIAGLISRTYDGFGARAVRSAFFAALVLGSLNGFGGLLLTAQDKLHLRELPVLIVFACLAGLCCGAVWGGDRAGNRGFEIRSVTTISVAAHSHSMPNLYKLSLGRLLIVALIVCSLAVPMLIWQHVPRDTTGPSRAPSNPLRGAPSHVRAGLEAAVKEHAGAQMGARGATFEKLAGVIAVAHATQWAPSESQLIELLGAPDFCREQDGHRGVLYLFDKNGTKDWFVIATFDPEGRMQTIGFNQVVTLKLDDWKDTRRTDHGPS